MNSPDLPRLLAERLKGPLPGRDAQRRLEPELSYGRHYEPPPPDARRAAVMALLYPRLDQWQIPLTVRPHTMADHAGQVSFPGGMIEPGETSQQAALRELHEELGVPAEGIEILGRLSDIYVFVSNFSVTPWVAVLREPPRLVPHPREVAEVLEAPVAHFLDRANLGSHLHETRGLTFMAPHFQFGSHRIWGATSMMLAELVVLLEELPR